jgi:protein tyrosine/serine phosphatase
VWRCPLIIAVGFLAIDRGVNSWRRATLPKQFAAVREGSLYRSGQMTREHFTRVVREKNIRTIVRLNAEPANDWEQEVAATLGARVTSFRMPGSGLGRAEDYARVLAILRDPSAKPILVHCAAGAMRTGVSVALYRVFEEGWTLGDATREMTAHGYDGSPDLAEHMKGLVQRADLFARPALAREASDDASRR